VGSGQAKSDSGCGCHTAARSTNGSAALLGLAGLALLRRRRSARARR
jgi:MYXO-CTERM domain-containing protein